MVRGESGFDEMETVLRDPTPPRPQASPGRYRLVLVGADRTSCFALPDRGVVLIGRAPDAEVRVDAPELSRKHARVHLGARITVEDLGSANGTRVGDARLPPGRPTAIAPGEPIMLGALLMVIQPVEARTGRPRRLLPHGYFLVRLESECARAASRGAVLAVVRLSAPGFELETVRAVVGAALRDDEIVAQYGPGAYELLLIGTTPEDAHQRATALVAAMSRSAPRDAPRVGLALYPYDARSPEGLLQRAGEAQRDEAAERREAAADVVVHAPVMKRLFQLLDKVAKTDVSVMLVGEDGVGKDVAAEALHRGSSRASRPFVRFDVASVPSGRVAGELFGVDDGGPDLGCPGRIEAADGGTMFLDEVGSLPLPAQEALLQVIEARKVLRVGARQPRAVSVRFVCASPRDLTADVEAGRFRRDLLERLTGISIQVPPLRDRFEEIPLLARSFVQRLCEQRGRAVLPPITPEALAVLCRYEWPGNVRELRNILERALALAADEITPEHLPLEIMTPAVPILRLDSTEG